MVGTFMFATVAWMPFGTRAADIDFLEKLIAIPSVSANIAEVNNATRCMRDYLVERGVHCSVETMDDGREVLYAATTPGKRHDFVFSVHLDVVPAENQSQFTLKRNGDRIEGRGVYDCKGNALVAAEVLCELAGKNVSVGCVFGPDEEIGGAATRWIVEEKGYVPNKMVIVIDAGYGKVCYAHKGQTFVRIRAKGRSGHSSRPWMSDDSITKVMQAYVKIREIWDRRHPLAEDKWSDVMVPTFVKADGGALNIIPSEVVLMLNLRSVNPGAKDELYELAREVSGCEVEVTRHSPPVNSDPNHPLIKKLQAVMSETLGKEVKMDRMLAATDARCFVSCGVPIALIGTAGGGAHAIDEYQTISSLDEMKAYLLKFLTGAGKAF
jgi:acetylornithine deacetylase/succinyl-diaminopimelate desuccinylase-like protein